jgi:hypothetical protein
MVHCPGDCHLVPTDERHCSEACDGTIVPVSEFRAVEAAFLARVVAAEKKARGGTGPYLRPGKSRPAQNQGQGQDQEDQDEDQEDQDQEDQEDQDEDQEDQDQDSEDEDQDDQAEEGSGRVWWAVQCDECGCHPREYFYHRDPDTDFCKTCFVPGSGQTFLLVTRGCPYSGGGITEATVVE